MKNLRYVGGDDIRELSPDDLQKLGVEDADYTLTFRKGKSTTVDDKVADALVGKGENIRESTPEELEQEERELEGELGFSRYNPSEHTVKEVSEELARSSASRREYILDQERANQNRKGIFNAVGADWEESPATDADEDEALDLDSATEEAMSEAGGTLQTSTGTGSTSGTGSTAGGGTAGPANTSASA
jgi:ribosomal protein L29